MHFCHLILSYYCIPIFHIGFLPTVKNSHRLLVHMHMKKSDLTTKTLLYNTTILGSEIYQFTFTNMNKDCYCTSNLLPDLLTYLFLCQCVSILCKEKCLMCVLTAEKINWKRTRGGDRQPGGGRVRQTSLHPAGAAGRPTREKWTQGSCVCSKGWAGILQKVNCVSKIMIWLISIAHNTVAKQLPLPYPPVRSLRMTSAQLFALHLSQQAPVPLIALNQELEACE